MANPDKQRGFKPVRHLNGASWAGNGTIVALPDDADEEADGYFVGSPVMFADESNTQTGQYAGLPYACPMEDEHDEVETDAVLGVIVGIARGGFANGSIDGQHGQFDPDDLDRNHVTVAEVEADVDGYLLYIAPANDVVFEVQNSAAEALWVGAGLDVSVTGVSGVELGNTTTGLSLYEANIGTETHAQIRVVDIPERPDNDAESANADMHVVFINPFGGAQGRITNGSSTTE